MSGLQTIISHGPGSGEAGVDDGGPVLQAMVMGTVKEVGDADGGDGGGSFDGGESGVIVDNVVAEQRFIAAAAAKVQSGEVIESAGSSDGGEEKIVLAIPKRMFKRWRFGLAIRVPGVKLLLGGPNWGLNDGLEGANIVRTDCETRR